MRRGAAERGSVRRGDRRVATILWHASRHLAVWVIMPMFARPTCLLLRGVAPRAARLADDVAE
eukprot:9008213-Alexandrium_andersonii.AAC.1